MTEYNDNFSLEEILKIVLEALRQNGYDPVNQLVGYLITGDPTYITSYNKARVLIMKYERDEILEYLIKNYTREHYGAEDSEF